MARPLRILLPGLTYHVTSRGNARMKIFLDDEDRRQFERLLTHVVEVFRVTCHALCQMENHYHAVLTTEDANLSPAMRELNGCYAQWWNKRHNRVGHVLQHRFGAQIVQDGFYFTTVCRYVALNPVRAGMVLTPEAWPWSSYRATIGLCSAPRYLTIDRMLGRFSTDRKKAVEAYHRFVNAARVRDELPRGLVIGDDLFASRFKSFAEGASPEVPRHGRDVERRDLREHFAGVVTRAGRNAQVRRAYFSGFSMAEIARTLGVHYSTVSRILSGVPGLEECGNSRPGPGSAADGEEVVVGAQKQAAAGRRGGRDDPAADVVSRDDLRRRARPDDERDPPFARKVHVPGAGDR